MGRARKSGPKRPAFHKDEEAHCCAQQVVDWGCAMNLARSTSTGTSDHTLNAIALRPKDAARALGIGERMLWTLTQQGAIPHARLGRCVVYPVAALEAWLAAKSAAAGKGGPGDE